MSQKTDENSGYRPMSISFPDIIYIMGTGRSGTTILEILLANNPGIFGVGEVVHMFKDGYMEDVTCSCGEPTSGCEVWSAVRERCKWNQQELPSLVELFRSISWHTGFPAIAMNLVSSSKVNRYRDVNRCLFQAVRDVSGASVIVDSSKYAGRALALARAFPGKVWIVCLTRSPAGLVMAFQKTDAEEQKPKSLIATFVYYLYVLICLRIVAWLLGPRVLPVRYEDMMADSLGTLSKIEKWCGHDSSSVRKKLQAHEWLHVGHIVTGNRLRKKGRVQFHSGSALRKVRGSGTRLVVWFMDLYRAALGF